MCRARCNTCSLTLKQPRLALTTHEVLFIAAAFADCATSSLAYFSIDPHHHHQPRPPHSSEFSQNPRNLTMSRVCQNTRWGKKKKKSEQLGSPFIFLLKPCCWYLICSILSSSFKSPPPDSIRSRSCPYLNLSLLLVHHISNANYLNLSVCSIPHIHPLVFKSLPTHSPDQPSPS